MTSGAQQAATPSKRVQAVKDKVAQLRQGADISVVRVHADEEYGTFTASGQDEFTFYDVDLKHDVTLRYQDVKKVKDGYGGYNSFRHRHTDRTKAIVIGAVVLGGLAALLIAVASAKD